MFLVTGVGVMIKLWTRVLRWVLWSTTGTWGYSDLGKDSIGRSDKD